MWLPVRSSPGQECAAKHTAGKSIYRLAPPAPPVPPPVFGICEPLLLLPGLVVPVGLEDVPPVIALGRPDSMPDEDPDPMLDEEPELLGEDIVPVEDPELVDPMPDEEPERIPEELHAASTNAHARGTVHLIIEFS